MTERPESAPNQPDKAYDRMIDMIAERGTPAVRAVVFQACEHAMRGVWKIDDERANVHVLHDPLPSSSAGRKRDQEIVDRRNAVGQEVAAKVTAAAEAMGLQEDEPVQRVVKRINFPSYLFPPNEADIRSLTSQAIAAGEVDANMYHSFGAIDSMTSDDSERLLRIASRAAGQLELTAS